MTLSHACWSEELTRKSEKIGNVDAEISTTVSTGVVIRALHWVRDGGYKKYMDVKKLDLIDGIWVATEMHVKKKKSKNTAHKTILKLNNVKFNQGLEFDMFTVRRMEKGL